MHAARFLFPFLALMLAAGCGDDPGPENADPRAPEFYTVTGVVTYDQFAVTEGMITFEPVDGGEAIEAPIRDGKYELTSPVGEYRITVTGTADVKEVPEGMTVLRAVRPDTTAMVINLSLPEMARTVSEPASPEQIREDNAERN